MGWLQTANAYHKSKQTKYYMKIIYIISWVVDGRGEVQVMLNFRINPHASSQPDAVLRHPRETFIRNGA